MCLISYILQAKKKKANNLHLLFQVLKTFWFDICLANRN